MFLSFQKKKCPGNKSNPEISLSTRYFLDPLIFEQYQQFKDYLSYETDKCAHYVPYFETKDFKVCIYLDGDTGRELPIFCLMIFH